MINLGDMFWSWLTSVILVMAPLLIAMKLHAKKLISIRSEIPPTVAIAAMGFVTILYLLSTMSILRHTSTKAIIYFSGLIVTVLLVIACVGFLMEKFAEKRKAHSQEPD